MGEQKSGLIVLIKCFRVILNLSFRVAYRKAPMWVTPRMGENGPECTKPGVRLALKPYYTGDRRVIPLARDIKRGPGNGAMVKIVQRVWYLGKRPTTLRSQVLRTR